MKSLNEIFQSGKKLLRSLDCPELEARLLLQFCTARSPQQFFAEPDSLVSPAQEKLFFTLIDKRRQGIPLAYLLGAQEFWGLNFKVAPGVLIPRPETELLVEKALERITGPEPILVDLGTGSGNIALSLAKHIAGARIYATEISEQALTIARFNAQKLQVTGVIFVSGDLFVPLKTLGLENQCDLIVSNPPYVAQAEWEELSSDIKDHEPRQALVPGETGLELIKRIVSEADKFLKPGGYLLFEIGFGQEKSVWDMLQEKWAQIKCFPDLAGIPRMFAAQKETDNP